MAIGVRFFVDALWQILVEFLFRLTLGIAVAMGLTSSREVTSGFFRVHLWVLMGICTFAVPAIYTTRGLGKTGAEEIWWWQFGVAVAAAIVSYVGSVIWLYERPRAGKGAIILVAALALAGCLIPLHGDQGALLLLKVLDRIAGSLVLGSIVTAMLLGHWYLNTPTMKLAPLKTLVVLIAVVLVARAVLSGIGAGLEAQRLSIANELTTQWFLFLSLRWLAGLFGTSGLAWLTWLTLKVPNTQSATGILYAAVILGFIGELTAQLMSASSVYPL